jgi:small subunit ribosomal protein S13
MFVFGDRLLDSKKAVFVAFRRIYGVGLQRASYISVRIGLSQNFPLFCVGRFFFLVFCDFLRNYYLIEGSLKRRIIFFLKSKYLLNSYRYLRYSLGLPLRGQRSRSNGQTRKRWLRLGLIVNLYK